MTAAVLVLKNANRLFGPVRKRQGDRPLKRRGEIGDGLRVQRRSQAFGLAADRGLQSREGKIAPRFADHRPRQDEALRVSLTSRPFERRAARISEAKELGGLVECLSTASSMVVPSGGNAPHLPQPGFGNARRKPGAGDRETRPHR